MPNALPVKTQLKFKSWQKQKLMRIDFVARLAVAAILWHSSAGVPSISVPRQDAADVTDRKADWHKLFSIGSPIWYLLDESRASS